MPSEIIDYRWLEVKVWIEMKLLTVDVTTIYPLPPNVGSQHVQQSFQFVSAPLAGNHMLQ